MTDTSESPTFADLLDGLAVEADEIRADVAAVVTEARRRLIAIEAAIDTLRPFAAAGVSA